MLFTRPLAKTSAAVLMALSLMSALVAPSAGATTLDVAGVKLEETVNLRGSPVVLNGAGVRYKAVFKVYVAALYLEKKVSTPEEVLALTGKKRVSVTMLRDIDANELGKLFTKGISDNAPKADFSKLIPGLTKTGEVFGSLKKLNTGDEFTIDYVPGIGTTFWVKGVQMLTPVAEPEYFNAVVRIWLGSNPADWKLKDAMLGKPA
jgi:Chalcone isomerase-like